MYTHICFETQTCHSPEKLIPFSHSLRGDLKQNLTSLKFLVFAEESECTEGGIVWSEKQFPWAYRLCSCVSCRTCFLVPLQHFFTSTTQVI